MHSVPSVYVRERRQALEVQWVGTVILSAVRLGRTTPTHAIRTLVPRSVTFGVRRTRGWGRLIATDTPGTQIGSKQSGRTGWDRLLFVLSIKGLCYSSVTFHCRFPGHIQRGVFFGATRMPGLLTTGIDDTHRI